MKIIKRDQKPTAPRRLLLTCMVTLVAFNLLVALPGLSQSKAKDKKQLSSQDIPQSVISGGGGTSTGGSIKMAGSIGQPATDAAGGGQYTLEAGFWPGAVPCPFAIAPLGKFFSAAGGEGSLNISASSSCSWSVSAGDSWIILTSADSGTGVDVVTYELRENFTASARQTTIEVSGQAQLIVQDGGLEGDCTYVISPAFAAYSAAGGSGVIQVATPERCAWQAVTSSSWITVAAPGIGISDGIVSYSVAANAGVAGRAATINIGGQTLAVKQKGN